MPTADGRFLGITVPICTACWKRPCVCPPPPCKKEGCLVLHKRADTIRTHQGHSTPARDDTKRHVPRHAAQ